ncbi:MAG: putative hemolysin [Planctomycetota bacterium]|jgi:putative hemolysin
MTLTLISLFCLLALSAAYSGSETGVYSLSRMRLEAEAEAGSRAARVLLSLVRHDTALLVTLLVGNNLMLELTTKLMQDRLEGFSGLPAGARELALTLFLTPIVFLFGELLPKDLFRRRPHQLLTLLLPILLLTRVVLFPLVWPLVQLSRFLERLFGLGETELAKALRREEVIDVLADGSSGGALTPEAVHLARNVLVLRETPMESIMVRWSQVEVVDLESGAREIHDSVQRAEYTRLPALGRGGDGETCVRGYLHQLDAFAAEFLGDPTGQLRELPALPPDLPVDRALKRMRTSGQRIALVGTPEKPLGLVSLMDLLATITGESAS